MNYFSIDRLADSLAHSIFRPSGALDIPMVIIRVFAPFLFGLLVFHMWPDSSPTPEFAAEFESVFSSFTWLSWGVLAWGLAHSMVTFIAVGRAVEKNP